MNNVITKDMLESAFALYADRLADGCAGAEFTPSADFERKMNKLIKSETSLYHRLTLTKARKALAAAAIIAVLLAASMSVTAIREKLFSFFITRGAQTDVIEYGDSTEPDEKNTIEKVLAPAYIPEGYKLEDSGSDGLSAYSLYSDGENFISVEQFVKSEYKSASDGEYTLKKEENISGIDFIVRSSDDGATLLVWEKDGYVFELVGFESEDELIKIALSVE